MCLPVESMPIPSCGYLLTARIRAAHSLSIGRTAQKLERTLSNGIRRTAAGRPRGKMKGGNRYPPPLVDEIYSLRSLERQLHSRRDGYVRLQCPAGRVFELGVLQVQDRAHTLHV